jgi:hypothetical protein
MKPVVVLVAAVAALALAATASAKELTSLKACGESGCTTVTDRDQLRLLPLGGDTQNPPPRRAPFYWLTYTISDGADPFSMYYVPSADVLGANGEVPGRLAWFPVVGSATDAIRDVVADLEPFPAPSAWGFEIKSPGRLPATGRLPVSPPAADHGGSGWVLWLLIVLGMSGVAVAGVLITGRRRPAATAHS